MVKNNMPKCDCCGKFVNLIKSQSLVISEETDYSKELVVFICKNCFPKYELMPPIVNDHI